jgi:hypothetical protein
MEKIDEKELARVLEKWFNNTNTTKIHFWNRNKVGLTLKNNLNNIGRWRNRKRGNPKRGYQIAKQNNNW